MIVIIIGTKAELIKTASLMLELEKQNKKYIFINTGQHNLTKECKEFGIRRPDVILSGEPKKGTKFMSNITKFSVLWSFSMILKIRKFSSYFRLRLFFFSSGELRGRTVLHIRVPCFFA